MNQERLETLLDRYFNQVLTREEKEELEAMLLESARARDLFWEHAQWNASLRGWGESSWGERTVIPLEKSGLRRRGIRMWTGVLAAAAMIMLGFWIVPGWMEHRGSRTDSTAAGVAVLTRAAGVAWADPKTSWQRGQVLPPGWLKLKSGAIQLEFSRGARVVLEGPAEFEIVSDQEAYLKFGKIRGFVPEPAHGFKVRCPDFSVVDQGTEFGCSVGSEGPAEVHVFGGKVEVQSTNWARALELKNNQAFRFDRGATNGISANPGGFLNERDVARLGTAFAKFRLERWKQAGQALNQDTNLLLRLDFERADDWERTIPNVAISGSARSSASIIGCEMVEGRWPGKSAVEFNRPDDRLRVKIPGPYESLTLAAWVRVDSLPYTQHSLLMTESFEPGEVHWYVYRDGSLGLGIRVAPPGGDHDWQGFHSEPVIQPGVFGTWVFLASVYDGATQTATHYFNGHAVGSRKLKVSTPLRLDEFEIGNWAVRPDDPKWSGVKLRRKDSHICNFQGRMDELIISRTAMTAREIRDLHEQGNPSEAANSLSER